MNEQIVKARIVLAHANSSHDKETLYPNELILYDFDKPFKNGETSAEIRLRIGIDDKDFQSIDAANELVLGNMKFYDSEPVNPELGDVWYNEIEETFYLGLKDNERIKLSHVIENIEDGFGEKSIQTTDVSQAYGKYSTALGYNTQAGEIKDVIKGYLFKDEGQEYSIYYITVNSVTDIAYFKTGGNFSLCYNGEFYSNIGKISEDDDGVIEEWLESGKGCRLTIKVELNSGVQIVPKPGDGFYFEDDRIELGPDIIGFKYTGNGDYAFAEGESTKAFGDGSHAEGKLAEAIGNYSHAEGLETSASGNQSHSEGIYTIAEGDNSHSEGDTTSALGSSAHSEGLKGIAEGVASHVEGAAQNEEALYDKSTGYPIKWDTEDEAYSLAYGAASHVEGKNNVAMGAAAHAEGQFVWAKGEQSHAEGKNTLAEGFSSHAEGENTQAIESNSHAEGQATKAIGRQSHAEGKETQAIGENSHAEGKGTQAIGENSYAGGTDSIAGSKYFRFDETSQDHAKGIFYLKGLTAELAGQIEQTIDNFGEPLDTMLEIKGLPISIKLSHNFNYIGYVTMASENYVTIHYRTKMNDKFVIPNAVDDNDEEYTKAVAINEDSFLFFLGHPELGTETFGEGAVTLGLETKAQLNASFAEGGQTLSAGQYAHAEGKDSKSIGYASHSEGTESVAEGDQAHAEGLNTWAKGQAAHAEGELTEALGVNSHTEGQGTLASGNYTHAEGLETQATAASAHAEGSNTKANGSASHSEGFDTLADGDNSHAEGSGTVASGVAAHTEGSSTTAKGVNSHAEGTATIASGKSQHVQGKYNIEDNEVTTEKPEGKYAHIVGNGTSPQNRSNAHTLDWNGNAWYAGGITGAIGNFITVDVVSDLNVANKLYFNSEGININNKANINDQGKGTFDEIATNKINVGENINLQDGNISTNNIQANNGHFVNGLTTGGEHYGTDKNGNQYSDFNPVLNFRGTVVSLDEITSPRAGDIVCIENLVEQKLLGFKVPKYDNFEGAIGTATKRVFSFLLTSNPNEYNPIAFSNYDNSPYNEILSYLLDDKLYNPVAEPGYDKTKPNTDILKNRRIKIDFGPGQKNSLIYINRIEWHNGNSGQKDENGKEIGLWSYEYYGTYDENGKVYKDFKNYDVTFSVDDMPLYENIPENMKKYAVVEPEETSNYFIYDADTEQWNDLTYNGKQLEHLIASSNLVTIGYSNYNNYIVNKNNSIINCIYQACHDGYYTMYIEPGIYYANENLTLPEANVTLIGLGKVIIDFAIQEADNSNGLTYTFYNLEFRKVYTNYVFSDGEIRYWNILNCNNCIFKEEISVTEINADRCEFYKNILCPYAGTNENTVKDSMFYQECTKLCFNNYYNCIFYIDSNINFGVANNNDLIFDCCKFYIFNSNVECYDDPDLIQSPIIKNSSFLQYPFANIECIDEKTCYINTNVQFEDTDLNYKGIINPQNFEIIDKAPGDLYKVESIVNTEVGALKYYSISSINQGYSSECKDHSLGAFDGDIYQTEVTLTFSNIDPLIQLIANLYGYKIEKNQIKQNIDLTKSSVKIYFDNDLITPNYITISDAENIEGFDYQWVYFNFIIEGTYDDAKLQAVSRIEIEDVNIIADLTLFSNLYHEIGETKNIGKTSYYSITTSENKNENFLKGYMNYRGELDSGIELLKLSSKNIGDTYKVLTESFDPETLYLKVTPGAQDRIRHEGYQYICELFLSSQIQDIIGKIIEKFADNNSTEDNIILTENIVILINNAFSFNISTVSYDNVTGALTLKSDATDTGNEIYNLRDVVSLKFNNKKVYDLFKDLWAYETSIKRGLYTYKETNQGNQWEYLSEHNDPKNDYIASTQDIEINYPLANGRLYIVYEE